MSKQCRHVKTLQVYFVKIVKVWNTTKLHYHHLTTNASLIIERSKRFIKQSENWIMQEANPNNTYLPAVFI